MNRVSRLCGRGLRIMRVGIAGCAAVFGAVFGTVPALVAQERGEASHQGVASRGQQEGTVQLCMRDVATGAPIVGATLQLLPSGAVLRARGDCEALVRSADTTVRVTRVSYVSATVSLRDRRDRITVHLRPRVASPTPLPVQRVSAERTASAAAGRGEATLSADEARVRGVTGMHGLLTQLPYTALRSARGETGLSLRGARREQVVVTLDGLPLNDPSTGLADVSDVPLVALQSDTLAPRSDPLGAGLGATGGLLALTTASQRLLSLRSGAFGGRALEGGWSGQGLGTRWHAAVAHRLAQNNFHFVNDAGAAPIRETRTNNDEQRTALTLGAIGERMQVAVLASTGERGMVGAANVRAHDADRSRTTRVNVRAQTSVGGTVIVAGIRWFDLAYSDRTRPALDSRARAWAADVEWLGRAPVGAWRSGAGADGLTGTGNVQQRRARGFAAWAWERGDRRDTRLAADLGMRADVVERSGVQPTAGAGVSWRIAGTRTGSHLVLASRAAQAVRVPTLYDLYFSSPQRLSVRALAPERVTLDASLAVRGAWQRTSSLISGEVVVVSRATRDAIVWFPGNFGWSPANVGRERLRGIESRVDLASSVLSAGVWGTWYESSLLSGGLTIPTPYVPRASGGAQLQWRLGTNARTAVSGNLRVQGRRPFTAGPRNALFELPSVRVLDVALSRRITVAQVDALVSTGIDNVTDARWQSVRGFPMAGRAWSVALTVQPRP